LEPLPNEWEVLTGKDVPGFDILRLMEGARSAGLYKARHVPSRRLVALKVSRLGPEASEERANIRREASVLRKLDHSSVVGMLESGVRGGRAFYSMEWLSGGHLGELLCSGPLPPREAIRMAARISGAIHHMHCRRFIYGDLRPSNIVFSGRGVAKLVDFELAVRLDRRGRASATGGDPRYMAPEQWLSEDGSIGTAADIYGLGSILFHALTGKLPYEGVCGIDRARQARILPEPSIIALRPSLPVVLDSICRKSLNPQPEQRYVMACDLASDLRRVLTSLRPDQTGRGHQHHGGQLHQTPYPTNARERSGNAIREYPPEVVRVGKVQPALKGTPRS
jgi:serine/threonine-protein kinase